MLENDSLKKNDYDLLPYESFAFRQSSPSTIGAVAYLFGVQAKRLESEKVRVLELGCASGGNIIPLAALYPNSEFIGIDLSEVEIKHGIKMLKSLNLQNVQLIAMSITDLNLSLGKFDYIICHGVLSWVPEIVREAIFSKSAELLNDNGVFYISYNTLPGWNETNTIRDMMIYHTNQIKNPLDKAEKAKELINIVLSLIKNTNQFYERLLEKESSKLMNKSVSYIFHDYLAQENIPFYFHQFIKIASVQGFQYIADVNLSNTFEAQNLDQELLNISSLEELDDFLTREQYFDFIINRKFRSSILIKKNNAINKNISTNSLKGLYFSTQWLMYSKEGDITQEDILSDTKEIILKNISNSEEGFTTELTITDPLTKSIFKSLNNNQYIFTSMEQLLKKIALNMSKDSLFDNDSICKIEEILIYYIKYEVIIVSYDNPKINTQLSKKPKLWPIARYQLNNNFQNLTSMFYYDLYLDPLKKKIIQHADGKNTITEIQNMLFGAYKKGEIKTNLNTESESKHEILSRLKKETYEILFAFAMCGFFET